jgi:hypothetical protein
MSKRDSALVRGLGLSVAEVARSLGRSRQTVNRGVAQKSDYFKPVDLAAMLGYWRGKNSDTFTLLRKRIDELYPEAKGALGERTAAQLSDSGAGQYWFLTGDFVAFTNNLAECASQLEQLCALTSAEVKLFVNERDKVAAQRLQARHPNSVEVIVSKLDLRVVPSTLIRMDEANNLDMFGAAESGFVLLSRQEAVRLRLAVQDSSHGA